MGKQDTSDSEGGPLYGRRGPPPRGGFGGGAEFVYESRPDAEVMPHVVEVLGVG